MVTVAFALLVISYLLDIDLSASLAMTTARIPAWVGRFESWCREARRPNATLAKLTVVRTKPRAEHGTGADLFLPITKQEVPRGADTHQTGSDKGSIRRLHGEKQ